MPRPTSDILPNLVILGQTVRVLLRRPTWKIWPLAPRLSRSLKVIRTDMDRSVTYDFILTFHCNYKPISYRFRDKWRFQLNGDFSWSRKFPVPRVFNVPAEGNCVQVLGVKNLEWWGYQADKEVRRLDTIHERDGRTDGQQSTAKTALAHGVVR